MTMFSEALQIVVQNTVAQMDEEMKAEIKKGEAILRKQEETMQKQEVAM